MISLECQGRAGQFGSLKALSNLSSLGGFHQILLDIIQRSQSFVITAVFVFIMIVVGTVQLHTAAAGLVGQDQLSRSCTGLGLFDGCGAVVEDVPGGVIAGHGLPSPPPLLQTLDSQGEDGDAEGCQQGGEA